MSWLDELPAPLRPEHSRFCIEATSADTLAFMRDNRARTLAAQEAAFAFAKEHGATSFFPPALFGNEPLVATRYAFDVKPADPAWTIQRPRAADTHYIGVPSKTAAGRALRAAMMKCVPYPNTQRELSMAAKLLSTLRSFGPGGSWGVTSIGSFNLANAAWTEDRLFISAANPFVVISGNGRSDDTRLQALLYDGTEYEGEPREWRPPEGWTLRSKAEANLIFATAAAEAERKAA